MRAVCVRRKSLCVGGGDGARRRIRVTGVIAVAGALGACAIGASPASAGVVNTIPVGSTPYSVSADGTHVWVTHPSENELTEIDASTATVIDTIPIEDPTGVSSDGTHVWVAGDKEDGVTEIEASTGAVIRTIPIGVAAFGVSSDGTHVWATGGDNVTEIEASTGAVINTIPIESHGYNVSSDGTDVWVTSPEQGLLTEIDASTGEVINTVFFGEFSSPRGVSSDGTHVWVALSSQTSVAEIDAATAAVIRTIPNRDSFDVSSDGTYVWVANFEERGTVSEIEASTGTVIHRIHVGKEAVGVSTDGTHAWVANYGGGTVNEVSPTPPGPTCDTNTAEFKISPGLTDSPAVQNIKVTGTLGGCEGEPFTGVRYTAKLTTAGPVTCSILTGQANRQPGPPRSSGRRKRRRRRGH